MASVAVHPPPETARTEHSADAPQPGVTAPPGEPQGPTLEDLILGAWEDLRAGHAVECPVCGGPLRSLSGCAECGAILR